MPYQVFGARSGALALTISWIRLAMSRSGFCISAIFASTSRSPSALPFSAVFSSRTRSFIAARSSAVKPVDPDPFLEDFVSAIVNHLAVLNQSEDVAVGIGDRSHDAAATDVVWGLLHGGAGGRDIGQFRLNVRHVPIGHRRGHALRPTARHQPDVLAGYVEAHVVGRVRLRLQSEQGGVHALGCRQV